MKYISQSFTILLALFACAFLPVHAASLDDLSYTTTDGKVAIIGCNEAATGELVIPATIEGNPVTSIGELAFSNCFSIKNITIPNSVVSIGDSAFLSCFSLTGVTIGNSVTSIGEAAFRDCTSLTSVTIPDSVTSIGRSAFFSCASLASITIPESVTSIGAAAFNGSTNLARITFLGAAPTVGEFAFSGVADEAIAYLKPEVLSSFGENGENWNGLILESKNPNETPLTWSTDNGEVTITDCDEGFAGELVIPDTIEGNPVTSIGEAAFRFCTSLTSITIPDGVTSIGDYAFNGCTSLTSITIPDSVTSIGDWTFQSCTSLMSITIPDSVTGIGNGAFSGCTSLTSITIPDSVTTIGERAFESCRSLTSITIPESVTNIGTMAFFYCDSLTSITLPDSVTSIGGRAFQSCRSLTSIMIPDGVTSIGENAFSECFSLTSITIGNGVTSIGSSAFYNTNISYDYIDNTLNYLVSRNGQVAYLIDGSNASGSINIPTSVNGAQIKLIVSSAFQDSTSLTSITIPDGVTSIGDYAFNGCTSLTSITIPDSVTSIGDWTFRSCTSLTSITIPDSVTGIGNGAFSGCTSLTSITIPDGVTSIGEAAFYQCNSLTSITIPDSITSVGKYAFYNCTSLASITIPDGVTSIDDGTFSGCRSLASITIPDGVTSIGGTAFISCTSLTSITIPDSVTSIGNQAFAGCRVLTSITFQGAAPTVGSIASFGVADGAVAYVKPEVLSSFGENGENWNGLILESRNPNKAPLTWSTTDGKVTITDCDEDFAGELIIPETIEGSPVTSIGSRAFQECTSLTSITIPDSVTSIRTGAFYLCTNLTSITIPDSVTSIREGAFSGCSSLTSVTIPASVTSIGERAFRSCTSLTYISIGDGVTRIEESVFSRCLSLTSITIPNSVTSIGESAFSACGLKGITIPDSVTSIGREAFWGNSSLASISLPDSINRIGRDAFSKTNSGYDYQDNRLNYRISRTGQSAYLIDGTATGSVTIPTSVGGASPVLIADHAFHGNRGLASITIPESVTSIGFGAFFACPGLTSITFLGTAPTVDLGILSATAEVVAFVKPLSLGSFGGLGANWNLMSVTVSDLSDLIISQPLTQDVPALEEVTFSITAVETPDSYQWSKDGRVIIGANSSKLTLSEVTSDDEGVYTCIMETVVGPIESNEARLTVSRLPQSINFAPIGEIGDGATEVMLSATSSSGLPVSYTSSNPSLASVTQNGQLEINEVGRVTITAYQNGDSIYASAPPVSRELVVINDLSISEQPSSQEVPRFGEAVFSVKGESRSSVTYQWRKNGADIEGAKSAVLRLLQVGADDEASYSCLVSNSYGSIESAEVTLTLIEEQQVVETTGDVDATLFYRVNDNEVTILDCNTSASGELLIPNSIEGNPVARIGHHAFSGCRSLTVITIPESVTNIGISAFYNCTSLTSITIPDGVTSIEHGAFDRCTSLTSITIPNSVTSIRTGAFKSCSALTSINIPDGVTSIGNLTFEDCISLPAITIPDGVTSIGYRAFSGCTSLTSITIPDSVTSIESDAFYECTSLTRVTFLGTAPEADSSFNNVADGAVAYVKPEALSSFGELGGNWNNLILDSSIIYTTTDGRVTITDCSETAAGELVIPDTIEGNPVTSIGDNAFGDCENLTSITIPESVTSIGIRAFWNCTSLASITIPESVTSIEDNAFAFCSKLTSVTIPEGVTLLGRGAFIRCSSLINISVDEGNLNYSSIEGVLFTKSQNNLLFFPSGREGSYSIPDAVTSITSFAFDSCLLSEVIIPDGVTSIGLKAFQYSSQLASIIIPEGVTSIEPETFRYATNLASVTLPGSLTTIGAKAFFMCGNLIEVVLEGPAPEVQSDAFTSIAEGAIALTRPKHIESYGGDGVSWEGLTVREISPPLIDLQRYYESLPDETVSIDATAIDGITDNYDYQWVFNGFPIPESLGGTAAVQVINGIEASEGKWKVVVTNRFGEAEHSFDYRILVDTDEDGLSDGYEELMAGTNPELPDTDGDGLNDFDETETHNTDPLRSDSDGDGFLDGFEVANKSGPLVANSQPNLTVEIALSDINGLPALKFETNPIVGGLITIEQSSDLKTWAPVVFFNGEGVAYETTIIRPPAAKSVYRLKVLDQTQ